MPDMSNTEIPSTSGDLERPGRFPKLRSLSSEGRQTASITLGADRCTALVEVAKEGTPTLFDLLKTAWPMLLADYIDSKTVSFGILSGDTDNEVAEQWFATLDLKQPISKVVTLEKLQEWPSREVGQSGQFNTFISRRGNTAFESKGNQTSLIGDILVIADDTHNSSQIDLYYHVSVLGPREAQHVITTLGAVLDSLVFSYEQPIAELNLLHDHHRDQIRSWNSHVPEKAINGCIHTLFQLQCAERPGSQAVCAWDGCFTYAEVDQMSDRVAARLQKYGIQEESIVPILLEKSKWVAVAMLGVLKVGAAFILMDVSYPTGRLLDICEDIQAQVLIQSVEAQAISRPMNVIAVDEGVMDWESSPPLRTAISPSNAAYVSYTSGSMGKPKGVIIEHGSFCTNALTTSKVHNLSSSSRVLQYASFAFDVSIQECLTPLLLGGCTCIPSEAQRINDLAESCVDLQVNWAELTPSVARLLQPEEVPSIKTLVLGGESTSSIDISKWQHLQLISAYGPAECTIVATVQPHVKEPNNIGRSYGGTCWIVNKDNHHRLLPIGAVGELVIGGPIVGRGYLNQPAQTEAVFFMNPVWAATFGLDRDYRYYRTGDLVRYNADGDIIYCGRKDTQVKIHGQRVELGEIEYHAQSCLSEDITVELGMRGNQRPFLVLFMAPKGQVTRDICSGSLFCEPNNEFRHRILHVKARLRNSLPDYMIPAVYIPLSGTPLSRTGKVDRKLLRSILSQLSDAQIRKYRISDPTYTLQTPATNRDRRQHISAGGDSITAISLVAEARKRGLEMTAASIFQSQSIRKLVANTDDICTRSTSPVQPFSLLNKEKDSLIPQAAQQCKISPSQVEDIYPCTPVQEAMMGSTMRNPSSFQAQFRFHLPMTLDVARFKDAWGTVLAARPILRTRIVQLDTPHALQVVVRSEERIPWHSVKHVQEVTQTLMLLGDPLIQLCMVSEPDERVQLTFILTMHHALFDKWSYKIILEEVEAVYRGLSVGWQSFTPFIKYIYCSDAANSKGFWKAEFMGLKAPEFPAAPAHSHSRTSVRRLHCHFQVPHWPPSSYTLSTVIRLAYAILISRSTHSHDIVFGVTVNGRNAPVSSIYDLAAPTIATLPLRTVLQPDISVQEMLVRMQEHATRLIPFEHTGIRWVKASSAEAALACDFKSLLVIQPPTRRGASHGLFGEALENDDELKFSTHPLTLICEIENNGWIHVTAVINSAVISPDETQALLRQFAGIFVQINDNLERPVSSIISDDTVVAASGYDSDKLLSLRELEMKAQYYLESLPGIDADTVVLEELPSAMLAVFVCDSRVNSNETWETDLIKKPSRTVRHVLSKLGEYLRQSMPDALTPFLCLPIKTLPKDSAGQPDREALRLAASNLCRKSQREFMFPVTSEPWCPTPSQLPTAQNIIARVLGVKADDVGSQDDFFTLGGDSSAAMQMVMLCKKEGFNLTVRDVFQERKIGRIASRFQPLATIKPPPDPNLDLSLSTRFSLLRLTCDYEKDKFETAVKAQLGIRSMDALEDAYPCTTVHEGLLWTQSHEPMVYQSHTIWEVTATGRHSPVCPFHLRDAWLILVRRHPALRTILVNNVFPEKTCKRIHIVLRDSPDDVAVFTGITNEMMHRPNLQSGACCLPYKFTIYQTQQNRVYCKLEGNQAFLDATSVSTLLQELAEAYSETLPSAPGPPYRSVVEYFQGMCNVARHTTYWKKQMATAEPCIFPSIRREGTRQDTLNVARIEIGDAIDLRQYCTTRGFTLSNVYQVAWGLTLRFYTSQNMICFGTLVSGRDLPLPDVHQTIGPFFNVLPCLLDLSRPDRLLQILRGNQAEIVNRLVNQHCSLTDILRHSNHFGQRLFNTCLSLEQQLSSLQVNSVRFTEIDTREPTEYILLSVIDKQATFEARLTYFSSIMSDKQAAEVVSRFAAYVSHILRNTDTM
ncbi:nonribosomal peptide synthase [Aspergillus novofumigatus IBT 16806]|uniref:Nonribosomal peptide synthase n=1 Tax=Aspergillus novofumigatus (strain IBT 16806) TaxID=1392255 RepID=A0A2I1BUP8_ASPN1|nr:nonribosomal peptide synthase [Aspergillus novofumigatus IBT 16806]PKX89086.1 nonribosomal peptide synthase [Aspergillus novofumigatus IBT 16806]